MSDIGDEIFFRVGGVLHEARMEECYGKMQVSSRKKWPETFKDFRRLICPKASGNHKGRIARMSTDWFLFSPEHKKKVMIGSIGLGGVKVWPTEYGGNDMLRWAIENHITDVVLVHEDDPRLDDNGSAVTNGDCQP